MFQALTQCYAVGVLDRMGIAQSHGTRRLKHELCECPRASTLFRDPQRATSTPTIRDLKSDLQCLQRPTPSAPKPPTDSRRTIHCRKPFPSPSPVLRTPHAVPAVDHESRLLPDGHKHISTFKVGLEGIRSLLVCLLYLGSLLDRDLFPSAVPEPSPSAQNHPPTLPLEADTDWFERPVSPGEPTWWRAVYEELSGLVAFWRMWRECFLPSFLAWCGRMMLGGRIRPL
jgi:hypothetical protein